MLRSRSYRNARNLVYSCLVSAEVDFMGGIVDCGVGLDTKTSPRRAAIEKAQAELRQEYDVREERRRELEFLEKGGNPLEFKFVHAASISVQSTSLTDQLAEHYVISEAKGSFALAASPHGDSVESSGRPGSSVGREPNTADNLLLLDGENSNPDGGRNIKRNGKRGCTALLEQTSQIDGSHNAKDSDDSAIFRLGVKSQAYARRNRSRSNRDSANVSSMVSVIRNNNRSLLPSSQPDFKDAKASIWEAPTEDHVSVSDLKPVDSKANAISKASAPDDQLEMEVDPVETHHTSDSLITDKEPEGALEVNTSENLHDVDHNHQGSHVVTQRVTNGTTLQSSDIIGKAESASAGFNKSLVSTENVKDIGCAEKNNGFSDPEKKGTDSPEEDWSRKTSVADTAAGALSVNSMETGPSCANRTNSIDGNADADHDLMLKGVDGSLDGEFRDDSMFGRASSDNNGLKMNSQSMAVDAPIAINDESRSGLPNSGTSVIQIKDEVEVCGSRSDMQTEVRAFTNDESVKQNGEVITKSEGKLDNPLGRSDPINNAVIIRSTLVSPSCEPAITAVSKRSSTSAVEVQNCAANDLKLEKKAREDAILKEARIIEANLKRAGELSVWNIISEKRHKCHWDYVLEEMAWMANDFMQERLWKTTAAAQVCRWIASGGRAKFEQRNMTRKQKIVARTLSKAIMQFWHSAEVLRTSGEVSNSMFDECNSGMFCSWKVNGAEAEDQGNKYIEAKSSGRAHRLAVEEYAIRFLQYNSSMSKDPVLAEAPTTPDRLHDAGILEMSGEDQLSEESLFYIVPPGAMQAYRESVESQWVHYKKMGNKMHQEDCEASICDSVADVPRENAYEEDEGETGSYLLPGAFESGLSSKFAHKKRKNMQQKSYAASARLYEVGTDLSYEPYIESKSGNQPLLLTGKRPSSTLNVGSIPTKRVRTASRQRVTAVTGPLQVTSKTDVSSGDTNSLQDDQSSLHGGSLPRKNMDVESTVDFERQLPYDGSEISTKCKKKKKLKHLAYKHSLNLIETGVLVDSGRASSYEQTLQVDSMVKHEPKDHVKKKFESPHFESNGNTVLYGQHAVKKPKLLKQLPETSPEALTPVTGSMSSPVASQMSNMSNSNKIIKIMANRDRGRKSKALKATAAQSGSGNPWSNFEDQALVVLVHDMGPNWELVSDAINSTLHFKCIFRKPKECKERHKGLMDKSAGDGADSAEDSGSSQPYPSTLPGIPKGSARQLFQRLQGPLEEDILKAHFEKIILLGQQLHSRRSQNDSQGTKQINPLHSSHVVALSQACPNYLTGGILTPLDLCDAISSSPDVLSLGYQGSHASGLAIASHQGSMAPILPSSSVNSMLQGSPGMVLGSSLPSPSTPLNAPTRDAQRYGVPRPTSLPVDDQQRMQQYGHMLSGRNLQTSSMSMPGSLPMGVDRGVRMLHGGNGMGMMCGINRGMAMPRPGFQGVSPPSMLNMVSSGNMLSSSGHGMQNAINVHPGAVSGPGNPMMRPRDALQMLRPSQNAEDHRQMMMQELQLQVSQGNGQAVSTFNGISAPFSNTTVSPPVQTFPVQQHQPSHQMPQQKHMLGNPHHPHVQDASNSSTQQQQAYAIRFAKERQLQQRMMAQPQHPFSGSNAMSPIQNSSQIQQQTQSSPPISSAHSSQIQHKQQNMARNPQSNCGMQNQFVKQRQRQQLQQQQQPPPPRQQQQQQQRQQQPPRQQQQQQQPPKILKGLGRGSLLMHQNLPVDASQVGGFPTAPKNQVSEKYLMQPGQGFFPGSSGLNPALSQPGNQPKIYSRTLPQASKQTPQLPSHPESSNQGSVQGSPSHALLASQQPSVPSSLPLANQQQQQQRPMNQPQQNIPKMVLQQNRQINPDGRIQSPADQVHVNQTNSTSSIPQCTDPGTSAAVDSTTSQWKPEPSYDTSMTNPATNMASSPQDTLGGTESLITPSSQGLMQRQFSGSMATQGHGTGGQWLQPQSQAQLQQQQPPQHQHRQAVQANLYVRPSDSGPG